jgi:hypothetical protein
VMRDKEMAVGTLKTPSLYEWHDPSVIEMESLIVGRDLRLVV